MIQYQINIYHVMHTLITYNPTETHISHYEVLPDNYKSNKIEPHILYNLNPQNFYELVTKTDK